MNKFELEAKLAEKEELLQLCNRKLNEKAEQLRQIREILE